MGKKQDYKKRPDTSPADAISGEYFYAVGRRKSAIATVRLYPKGTGTVVVNDTMLKEYFPLETQQMSLLSPLEVTSQMQCDVTVHVKGGGKNGQADAVRLGIARALIIWQEGLRPVVKAQGFLTRDARIKERKKPGLKRARRAPQFSKR